MYLSSTFLLVLYLRNTQKHVVHLHWILKFEMRDIVRYAIRTCTRVQSGLDDIIPGLTSTEYERGMEKLTDIRVFTE